MTINGAKYYNKDIVTLENYNSMINSVLSDYEIYNDYEKIDFEKYDYYSLFIVFDFAVDNERVGHSIEYFENGPSYNLVQNRRVEDKIPYNFPIEIPNKVNLELYEYDEVREQNKTIVDKLKEGKLFLIKVTKIEIKAHIKGGSYSNGYQTIFKHNFDNIIFKFSLKGSSDALRWYK